MSTCRLISSGWLPLAPLCPGSIATTAPSTEPAACAAVGGGAGAVVGVEAVGAAVVVVVVVLEVAEELTEAGEEFVDAAPALALGGALSPHALTRTRQRSAATAQRRRGRTARA